MPKIEADTELVLRVEDAPPFRTTMGLMAADDGVREEFPRIKAALEAGEVYRGGGGAAPMFTLEIAR